MALGALVYCVVATSCDPRTVISSPSYPHAVFYLHCAYYVLYVHLTLWYAHLMPPYVHISLCPRYAQEFIGVLAFTWTIALTINSPGNGFIGVGFMLSSLVYAGGSVSGAHYNPMVTLAIFIRNIRSYWADSASGTGHYSTQTVVEMIGYVTSQIGGAFIGGLLAATVNGGLTHVAYPTINHTNNIALSFIMEFIFATALALTVLCTATNKGVAGNQYYGLAIGACSPPTPHFNSCILSSFTDSLTHSLTHTFSLSSLKIFPNAPPPIFPLLLPFTGFIVLVGVVTVGDVSGGGCFNPAVSVNTHK